MDLISSNRWPVPALPEVLAGPPEGTTPGRTHRHLHSGAFPGNPAQTASRGLRCRQSPTPGPAHGGLRPGELGPSLREPSAPPLRGPQSGCIPGPPCREQWPPRFWHRCPHSRHPTASAGTSALGTTPLSPGFPALPRSSAGVSSGNFPEHSGTPRKPPAYQPLGGHQGQGIRTKPFGQDAAAPFTLTES